MSECKVYRSILEKMNGIRCNIVTDDLDTGILFCDFQSIDHTGNSTACKVDRSEIRVFITVFQRQEIAEEVREHE